MDPEIPEIPDRPARKLSDADLADEFAEVRLRWKAWQPNVNPHAARFAELQAELLRRQEDEPADRCILVTGTKWTVPITARENRSKIVDPAGVYRVVRRLGIDKLLETYTITLERARKILTAEQVAKFIETERTGPREIREPVLREARS